MNKWTIAIGVLAIAGIAIGQVPVCKAKQECYCEVETSDFTYSTPACLRAISLLAPTATNRGCCKNPGESGCNNELSCSFSLCANVSWKDADSCEILLRC